MNEISNELNLSNKMNYFKLFLSVYVLLSMSKKNSNPSCILSNHVGFESFTFNENKELNDLLFKIYNKITFETDKYIKNGGIIPNHSNNKKIFSPFKIKEYDSFTELFFQIPHHSILFSNSLENKIYNEYTKFHIKEQKDIHSNDYAYVTLLFPNYDINGLKHYDYLIGTCLLGMEYI